MLNFVLTFFLSQLTVGMKQVCLVPNTLPDGFLNLIRHCFFFPVKNQIAYPLQTPQQKHCNLSHLIVAVHFFYKSGVAYLEKILFGISAWQHSWINKRMTRSCISWLQHILLPWQQLTNDLHFQKYCLRQCCGSHLRKY